MPASFTRNVQSATPSTVSAATQNRLIQNGFIALLLDLRLDWQEGADDKTCSLGDPAAGEDRPVDRVDQHPFPLANVELDLALAVDCALLTHWTCGPTAARPRWRSRGSRWSCAAPARRTASSPCRDCTRRSCRAAGKANAPAPGPASQQPWSLSMSSASVTPPWL